MLRKNNAKKAKISKKMEIMQNKNENFAKNTEFLKTNAKFWRKSCENSSKKTKF